MPRYHFPGYPAFLDAAAAEVGQPEAAVPARRNETLAALAGLCAQASEAEDRHVAGILAKAQEMVNQLRVAHRASELILAAVRAGRSAPDVTPSPRRPRPATASSDLRGAR